MLNDIMWRLSRQLFPTFVLVGVTLLSTTFVNAQRFYPIEGGTRIESEPKNKNRVILIAESDKIRITIKSAVMLKGHPILAIWMKIENLSDNPLAFTPSTFIAVDDEGRSYSGLEPEEAAQLENAAYAMTRNMAATLAVGRLGGQGLAEATEKRATSNFLIESLRSGDIYPGTFKDGKVYFENPQGKTNELRIRLGSLWDKQIILTSDKKQLPR